MDISNIRVHMKVIGSDQQPVGTVDKVEGDRIKLSKSDPQADGKHHFIPSDWIDRVDGEQVRLRQKAQEVRSQWQS